MTKPEPIQPEGVTIVEATGYAGGNHGPTLPLVQLAMRQATDACFEMGIADDTPNQRLTEIVGSDALVEMFGDRAGEVIGADFIRERKLAARNDTAAEHRGLLKAHEASKATELHAARDA